MSMRMAFGTASGALLLTLVILASVLIGARACGAGGEAVYVQPEAAQTTPIPEQRQQSEASHSAAAQSQTQPAAAPVAPQTDAAQSQQQPAVAPAAPAATSAPSALQPTVAATETPPQPEQPQPTVAPTAPPPTATPPPAVNQRWQNKRNDLCSTLGLDAAVCGNIALNQSAPEGEAQDIQLPDEPDATPAPVDDVDAATSELEEAIEAQGEVSIQALTYVESLISQAAEAVVQAEQELANQQATSAYLDQKRAELQQLRRTYADLLRQIGVELDKALDIAEQIEAEHLAFSIERAAGEALIRYKDVRLTHAAALANAERDVTTQIDAVVSANKDASTYEPERTDLAPLYKARDEAQAKYDSASQNFVKWINAYEKNWLAVYDVYITDPTLWNNIYEPVSSYTSIVARFEDVEEIVWAYHYPMERGSIELLGMDKLLAGTTSEATNRGDFNPKSVNLTLLRKAVNDANREIARATAANEKAQRATSVHIDAASAVGAAIIDARLAVVEAYREYGISEGRAGQIFRFTDNGEDAVTYNISITALNADADANLASFKTALNGVLDDMHAAIRAAEDARDKALADAEDTRFASADTLEEDQQKRSEWQDSENLRRRILLTDALMMSAGWGAIYNPNEHHSDWTFFSHFSAIVPGHDSNCASSANAPYFRTATGIGRDAYIRKYWYKEQPIERTYTDERLAAVESVVDKLEEWLDRQADYWWDKYEQKRYNRCEQALNWFSGMKAEIVRVNPLPTD